MNVTVKVRFFARFRELLGTDIATEPGENTSITALIQDVARNNSEGFKAIFNEQGEFREFVIVMQNGRRVELSRVSGIYVRNGDEIAVFPPVAGG